MAANGCPVYLFRRRSSSAKTPSAKTTPSLQPVQPTQPVPSPAKDKTSEAATKAKETDDPLKQGDAFYEDKNYDEALSSDGTFLSTIPSVGGTVTSFRFFTGDGDMPPPQGLRSYLTRFPKATVKAIYYELTVKYATDNASTFNMTATWTLDRQPFAKQNLPLARPQDWNISTRSYGLYKEPGKWEAGTYTVEIEVEGRKVAAGSFVVY